MQANRDPVRLRSFAPEDLRAIYLLDRECFRQGISYSQAEMTGLLRRKGSFCLIAEDPSGALAGFAIAELPARSRGSRGQIITIDIAASFRRRGIGSMLMEALEDELIERGAIRCTLEVAVDDPGAQEFYADQGYRPVSRISGYYMGTLDALVMEKELVTPWVDKP
jgi:[ribosomal protein S18]-alanine N-acetyltransferase